MPGLSEEQQGGQHGWSCLKEGTVAGGARKVTGPDRMEPSRSWEVRAEPGRVLQRSNMITFSQNQ